MFLSAKSTSNKSFKLVPPGAHLGRLYRIVDIGTQQGEWQGKVNHSRKIILSFELHGEDMEGQPLTTDDGKPLIVSKYYNQSLYEKSTLRKHLQAWLNIDFDKLDAPFNAKDLLGKFAMLSISHKEGRGGDTRAAIDSLSPVPAIIQKAGLPQGVNAPFLFDLNQFDSEKFNQLSEGIQNVIKESPEYRALSQKPAIGKEAIVDDFNDSVPF